jgi:hypothetical protein
MRRGYVLSRNSVMPASNCAKVRSTPLKPQSESLARVSTTCSFVPTIGKPPQPADLTDILDQRDGDYCIASP